MALCKCYASILYSAVIISERTQREASADQGCGSICQPYIHNGSQTVVFLGTMNVFHSVSEDRAFNNFLSRSLQNSLFIEITFDTCLIYGSNIYLHFYSKFKKIQPFYNSNLWGKLFFHWIKKQSKQRQLF